MFAAEADSVFPPAIIAAIISALVTWGINVYMNVGHNARFASGQVQKIIEFSITYPYLEDDEFCNSWPNITKDPASDKDDSRDRKQRYENYCCHVFNTIEAIYEICKGEHDEMCKIMHPDEMILRHRKWWETDTHNRSGYSDIFNQYVLNVLIKHHQRRA